MQKRRSSLYGFGANRTDAAFSSIEGSINPIFKSSSTVSFSRGRKPRGVRKDGGLPSRGLRSSSTTSRFGSGVGNLVEAFFEKKPSRWASRCGRLSRTRRTWAGSSPVGKGIGLPSKVFHFAVLTALILSAGGGPVREVNGTASVGVACFCHRLWRGSDWILARRADISTVWRRSDWTGTRRADTSALVSSSAEGRLHGAVSILWILLV